MKKFADRAPAAGAATDLRTQAEAALHAKTLAAPAGLAALSPDATRALLHELQVHQIELEMQNDELRRAQHDLEQSRARYYDLYDLAPVGYCTVSEAGLIQEANLHCASLLGITRATLIQRPFHRFIISADQDRFYRLRQQVRAAATGSPAGAPPIQGELTLAREDGTTFPAQLMINAVPGGRGEGQLLLVLTDLTAQAQADQVHRQDAALAERARRALLSTLEEQKRAQTAVREREARYGAMVNSIADAIISADCAGHVIGWNPGAENIFGYQESEILGQPLTLLLPTRHHERHEAGLARVLAGGPHHIIGTTVDVEGRRKDGREFPLNLSLSEWQIGGQKFFTAIIRDVTEQKAAAANLAAKMEELRRWQGATLGREGRVLGLKREINALRASHGEPPKYPSVVEGAK